MRSEGRGTQGGWRGGTRRAARPARPQPAGHDRRRRDRRGRGLRGTLAPRDVPISRTRSEAFDDLVLAAVDELEQHWASELAELEFAVEDVPPGSTRPVDAVELGHEAVVDRGVVLGRLLRDGTRPVVVVYRRPVEARSLDREDRADLVFMVVVDLVAEFLGRDIDEIDPP